MRASYNPGMYQRPPQQNYSELIRSTFYNQLINFVIMYNNTTKVTRITLPSVIKHGIERVIVNLLEQSRGTDGIVIDGGIVTRDMCPPEYKVLFEKLIQLKSVQLTPQALTVIAGQIQQLDNYKVINPTDFLLGALGLEAAPLSPRRPLANSFERMPEFPADVVTPEDIRERFYNEMAEQAMNALDKGYLTLQQLNEQDPVIFSALTELTLLEAIQQSQQCTGIQLLRGKVVDLKNAPNAENFPALVKSLLAAKEQIRLFSPVELLLAKKSICECETAADLEAMKGLDPSFKRSLGILKHMSLVISESRVFQNLFMQVMQACGANIYAGSNAPEDSNATQGLKP